MRHSWILIALCIVLIGCQNGPAKQPEPDEKKEVLEGHLEHAGERNALLRKELRQARETNRFLTKKVRRLQEQVAALALSIAPNPHQKVALEVAYFRCTGKNMRYKLTPIGGDDKTPYFIPLHHVTWDQFNENGFYRTMAEQRIPVGIYELQCYRNGKKQYTSSTVVPVMDYPLSKTVTTPGGEEHTLTNAGATILMVPDKQHSIGISVAEKR